MISIDPDELPPFLSSILGQAIERLEPIGQGMFSEAYGFSAAGQDFILRLNHWRLDLEKDHYAYVNFSSADLPIPAITHLGSFRNDIHFAVSERAPGKTISERESLDPRAVSSILDALAALHLTDVRQSAGWGLAGADGHGRYDSWTSFLLAFDNHKFEFTWEALIRDSFLEGDLVATLKEEVARLTRFCPAGRWLVHGDFGYDNLIVDASRVTGVLDWAEYGYGDYLYDVAYLDFWSDAVPYGELWLARATRAGRTPRHFEERMRCYTLTLGLGSLAIAAILDDHAEYSRMKRRTLAILNRR